MRDGALAAALVVGGILLGACKGNTVASAPPAIEVQLVADGGIVLGFAQLLDGGLPFGTTPVLVPALRTLTVTDLGGGTIDLGGFAIAGTDGGGPFSLVGTPPVAVGQSGTNLTLQFLPTAQEAYTGTLSFTTNDPAHSQVDIALSGAGSTEGQLSVSPNPLVFGSVGQGQTQLETLTLTSSGTAPLVISGVPFGPGTDPAFGIVSSVHTPFTLPDQSPGNTLQLTLSFSPTSVTPVSPVGSLLIQSSDPAQQPALTVPLEATTVLAPVAAIPGPTSAPAGTQVLLDGSGSSDPNTPPLLPLTYAWALDSKPAGSTAELSSVDDAGTALTLDQPGDYSVSLGVTNSDGIQSVPAVAAIHATTEDDLVVQLVWDNDPVNMELHLIGPGGKFNGPGDCNAYSPDAGFDCIPGSDHLVGPGPDTAAVQSPEPGTYTIDAVYAQEHDATTSTVNATVRVYLFGVLSWQGTQQLTDVGSVWSAASISWPAGSIAAVGTVTP